MRLEFITVQHVHAHDMLIDETTIKYAKYLHTLRKWMVYMQAFFIWKNVKVSNSSDALNHVFHGNLCTVLKGEFCNIKLVTSFNHMTWIFRVNCIVSYQHTQHNAHT